MPLTALITGFGPFPGAPFNPTAALAARLARLRRPALADVARTAHVFETSYAAVDRELPALLARVRPDVLLMFGLAVRTRHMRIETTARNAIARILPDATGVHRFSVIAPGWPRRLKGTAPFMRLAGAARGRGIAVKLSDDAGEYLCNYLYFRALEETSAAGKPRLVQFVHVPLTRRHPRPSSRVRRARPPLATLLRTSEAILVALVSAARRR